jgi:hypothetical protein
VIWAVPPGVDVETARQAYAIAAAHWPDNPCVGQEQIGLARQAVLEELAGDSAVSGADVRLVAVAAAGSCRVLLNDEIIWTGATLCMIAEHEYGHLAGLGHSPDPDDVMAAVVRRAPDCEAVFGEPDPDFIAQFGEAHVEASAITARMVGATIVVKATKKKACRVKVAKNASAKAKKAARRCRLLRARAKARAKAKARARAKARTKGS